MPEKIKHLNHFKIQNFKRFQSFEMENVGQFNLIVGDNNAGKTSILEALLIDENINQFLFNIDNALFFRNINVPVKAQVNYLDLFENKYLNNNNSIFTLQFKEISKKYSIEVIPKEVNLLNKSELSNLSENITSKTNPKFAVIFNQNKNKQVYSMNLNENTGTYENYTPFVSSGLSYQEDLVQFYSENIQNSKILKEELIYNLKILIPDLEEIEISINAITGSTFLMIRQKGMDGLLPITSLGEGSVRLFRILIESFICKNRRIMIDDIDSGIYFQRYNVFWKTILKFALLYNVQIFATTHNLECLKYFSEALHDDDMIEFRDKSKIFNLLELPNKQIKAYGYEYDEFAFALDKGHELRGV